MSWNGSKIWYCYLLLCRGGSLYCGAALNPEAREKVHNAGRGAKYTRSRRPVKLVWKEPCGGRGAALRREYEVKKMSREQKLELTSEWVAGEALRVL